MRLLTYNIHKGVGGRDRRYRLNRIIDVIEAENPDLMCLQEVVRGARRARRDDQPRILADYFKAAAAMFQMNVHYAGGGGYGNLILSRWPIDVQHQISLRLNSKKPRGAQLAVIRTPEGPMQLVNWHLGLAERERHWQIARLLTHRLFREADQLPTLLAGDANDWRNTLAAGALAEHGLDHVTHPVSRFLSFPAWMPVGALDKVFLRGPIEIRAAKIVRSKLAHRASDHLPLVVDFHLDGAVE